MRPEASIGLHWFPKHPPTRKHRSRGAHVLLPRPGNLFASMRWAKSAAPALFTNLSQKLRKKRIGLMIERGMLVGIEKLPVGNIHRNSWREEHQLQDRMSVQATRIPMYAGCWWVRSTGWRQRVAGGARRGYLWSLKRRRARKYAGCTSPGRCEGENSRSSTGRREAENKSSSPGQHAWQIGSRIVAPHSYGTPKTR